LFLYQVIRSCLHRSLSLRTAKEFGNESLPVREYRGQIYHELPHFPSESGFSITLEQAGDSEPPGNNRVACLGEFGMRRISDSTRRGQLLGDPRNLFPERIRATAPSSPIVAVSLGAFAMPSDGSWRRIRGDALVPHHPRKILAPFAQRGLVDVEPRRIEAIGLHHQVHVRMSLMSMERHGVTVLQSELLAR